MSFKSSAPGSLMLLGEHAVLHGKLALVCAVDKRISVIISPRSDKKITIQSALGSYATDISNLKIAAPFQFVLATLKKMQRYLISGCDIEVISEFSDKIGFGSSAAVTVATLSVLSAWLNLKMTSLKLIRWGRDIVQTVQGIGSGADVAASVLGGVVAYRMSPLRAEKLACAFPLTVVYSGSKTPTRDVIQHVKQKFAKYPELFEKLCSNLDFCARQGEAAILAADWPRLGEVMNVHQGLMDALGVNTPVLNTIVYNLRGSENILGSKISGSGLGDCVIGLGPVANKNNLTGYIPVTIAKQGALCE